METDTRTTLLSTHGLFVQFGKLLAVRDVSLELRAGDLLGLIGPNGAGKTTLLRAIAGLQPLSSGQISLLGEVIDKRSFDRFHHIGFTPDTPPFYEELTVRDFLRFIAKGYGLPDARERIDFWLEKVWLTEKATQKIKGLSRGMKQRLGIARTLLANPTLVLLDEPAAGLDPAGRAQFRQLLCNLRDQGKALIVSSHILSDLSEYCTHIGIMSAGSMVQYGTVAHVSGASVDGRCRYSIVLATPLPRMQEMLTDIEGVTHVQVDTDRITLEYSAERQHAADLLRLLLSFGVSIAAFAPHAPDLEEAYLKTGIKQVD